MDDLVDSVTPEYNWNSWGDFGTSLGKLFTNPIDTIFGEGASSEDTLIGRIGQQAENDLMDSLFGSDPAPAVAAPATDYGGGFIPVSTGGSGSGGMSWLLIGGIASGGLLLLVLLIVLVMRGGKS